MKLARRCLAMAVFVAAVLQVGSAFAVSDTAIPGVAFADSQHGYLVGGFTGLDGISPIGVLSYTSDGGATFKPSQYPGRKTKTVGTSSNGASATAAADYIDDAVFTTDNGGTWSSSSPVFGGVPKFGGTSHIAGFAYLTGGRVAVGYQVGTSQGDVGAISREIGGAWNPSFMPLYPDNADGVVKTYAQLNSVDATAGGTVAWAAGAEYSEVQHVSPKNPLVYRTTDGGLTWANDLATSGTLGEEISAVAAANSDIAYATSKPNGTGLGSRNILRRNASGVWARMAVNPATGFNANSLDAYDADHVVVVGDAGKVYYSANASTGSPIVWTLITSGTTNNLFSVQMTGPNSWVAVGDSETVLRFAGGAVLPGGSVAPTPPTVSITSPAPNYHSLGGSITGIAADTGVGVLKVELQIARGATYWNGLSWVASPTWLPVTGTTSWSYLTIPADLPSSITARATDGLSLSTDTTVSSAPIDLTPPTTTIASNPATSTAVGGWIKGPVSVSYTATDGPTGSGVASTWSSIDGTPAVTFANPTVIAKNGTTDFKYFSVDTAGNAEATRTLTFKADSIAPVTTSDAVAVYPVASANNTITLSPTDTSGSGVANTTFKITTNPGGAPVSGPTSGTVASLPKTKGGYRISYNSRDLVGNTESTKTADFAIGNGDITPPTVSINVSPSSWTSGTVDVKITAVDASSTIGGVQSKYSSAGTWDTRSNNTTFTLSDATGGTLQYRAWDSQDNTSTPGTVQINIDKVAPSIGDNVAASYPVNSSATITLTSTDTSSGVAGTYWKFGSAAETSGKSVPVPAAAGTYTLSYRAIDNAGNQATKTKTVTVSAQVTLITVWRFRNTGMVGNYLWTPDPGERDTIKATLSGTWAYEGGALYLNANNPTNSDTMWRFKNKFIWSYFYTADPVEMNAIKNNPNSIWTYEGPTTGWTVSRNTPTSTPVWRFQCLKSPTYLWTADPGEMVTIRDTLKSDYKLEGIAYWLGQ